MTTANKPQSLYLHVPFCAGICSYCAFMHVRYQQELVQPWLQAIARELQAENVNRQLRTLYLGGGTPSALSLAELQQLLELLQPYTGSLQEYTVEINPGTLDAEKARLLASYGVNRASVGYQCDNDAMLASLGRHHTLQQTRECLDCLRQAGITNISLDLLYGLPGQTLARLEHSLQTAFSLAPQHLSLYSLEIYPDTVLGRRGVKPCDPDLEADMYERICRELPAHGYERYEVASFARPGFASQHNLTYWHYEDFYGIGCGASGKIGSLRYDHTRSLPDYINGTEQMHLIRLSPEEERFEAVMMGLRLCSGIDRQVFRQRYGSDVEELYPQAIARLKQEGLLVDTPQVLKTSQRGMELLNSVLEEILEESGTAAEEGL